MDLSNVEKLRNDLNNLFELQKIINELKKSGFKKYITERKLHLIDDKFKILDQLLKDGILK